MNMKFWNAGGGKNEDLIHVVKNAEASVEIPAGTPCIYAMNGTDDGLAVVLPSSSTAVKASVFLAGVAQKTIPIGKMENVQVYGFNRFTRVYRGSRAASTDAWPTFAAFAIGDILQVNTVANAFASSAVGAQSGYQPMVVVAEVVASVATMASSVLGINAASALSFFSGVKTFLRFM
jgi:hypothetical protein